MTLGLASALLLQAVVSGVAQQRPAHGTLPSVSPDGHHIVFLANRDGTNDQLYVIGDDGSGETVLTHDGDDKSRAQWSADGTRLVYTVFAHDTGTLFSLVTPGGGRSQVARAPGRNLMVLPGSHRVLFSSGSWATMQISVADPDGSGSRRVSDGSGAIWNPTLAPESTRVAYTRSARDTMQVWVMNVDGSGAAMVTRFSAEEGRPQMPAWSPDGRRLAVQANRVLPRDRADRTTQDSHIWIIDLETRKATKLAPHAQPYLDEAPSWFPDGRRIAFQSDRTGRMEIWVMRIDGSGQHQITR